MSQPLGEIFKELGISQYLSDFVDQGFDTWDTILDITESDLDALNVKLGHRRKLQRRIANSRGLAPDAALASPTGTTSHRSGNLEDAQRAEIPGTGASKPETTLTAVVTKRKYRRHPKSDENAPERPPSAYVLFSNKTRDDLKDRNLTFTEIAKLVGENWQALTPAEKEPFETQAQTAKEKYIADLAEYKQTAKYKEYLSYLQDFKAKHATTSSSTDGKDCQKRVKLSDSSAPLGAAPRRARSHTSTGIGSASRNGSRSNSRGDGRKGSEPPPTHREHRVNSISSNAGDYTVSSNASLMERSSVERSPSLSASPRDPPLSTAPVPAWLDGNHGHHQQQHPQHGRHNLPSLSNILEGQVVESCESRGSSGAAGYTPFSFQHAASFGLPGSPPGLVGGDSSYAFPSRKEFSSGASTTSASSVGGYPHTPVEGSLPIHLLLVSGSGKHDQDHPRLRLSLSPENRSSLINFPPERHPSSDPPSAMSMSPPLSNAQSYFPPMSAPPTTSSYPPGRGPNLPSLAKFDGMSALLQAGEIVGRQVR